MNQRSKHTAKTMTLLEENIQANLHDLGSGNDFLDILKAQARNEKIDKLDFSKVQNCF